MLLLLLLRERRHPSMLSMRLSRTNVGAGVGIRIHIHINLIGMSFMAILLPFLSTFSKASNVSKVVTPRLDLQVQLRPMQEFPLPSGRRPRALKGGSQQEWHAHENGKTKRKELTSIFFKQSMHFCNPNAAWGLSGWRLSTVTYMILYSHPTTPQISKLKKPGCEYMMTHPALKI